MKIEHFAFNVEDPVAVRGWYTKYLGLSIVKSIDVEPYTTFMADSSGTVMLEIYCNPKDQVPDYRSMNPLLLHIAFISEDPAYDKKRLTDAGATIESDQVFDDGSHLVMLRDPWGLALQLCKRGKPMI